MAEGRRKPSLDNPEYFMSPLADGVTRREAGGRGRTVSQSAAGEAVAVLGSPIEGLLPPTEIMESLERIERFGEKASKGKGRNKLSLSLKRLFSSSSRRDSSSGQANEYLPSPSTEVPAPLATTHSLPTTPIKVPSFLHYPSLGRTKKSTTNRLSEPPPQQTQDRLYYNVEAGREPNNNTNLKPMLKKEVQGPKMDVQGAKRTSEKPPLAPGKTRLGRSRTVQSSCVGSSVGYGVSSGAGGGSSAGVQTGPPPVPGMEAPPLPVLHSVCKGYTNRDVAGAVILYSGTCPVSTLWLHYLQKMFQLPPSDCRVVGQRIEQLGGREEERRGVEERVYHARTQLVLVSPSLLSWLCSSGLQLARLLWPGRAVALLQGVSVPEVESLVGSLLPSFSSWRRVELATETGDSSDFTIQGHLDSVREQQEQEAARPREPLWRLFPRKVSQGQPKVQLCLDSPCSTPCPDLALQITLQDTTFTLHQVKWLKDDLIQVELPCPMFQATAIGSMELVLQGKHLGSRQLKLENAATVLESAWQAAGDPVSLLSDAFSSPFSSLTEVDSYLAASLERRLSVSDLLSRPSPPKCQDEDVGDTVRDHATLLHFAATHGLTRLAHCLLSIGFSRFLTVPNILGLTPPECADRAGHPSLAAQLRARRETTLPRAPVARPASLQEGSDGYLLPIPALATPAPALHPVKVEEEDWYQVPTSAKSLLPPSFLHTPSPPLSPTGIQPLLQQLQDGGKEQQQQQQLHTSLVREARPYSSPAMVQGQQQDWGLGQGQSTADVVNEEEEIYTCLEGRRDGPAGEQQPGTPLVVEPSSVMGLVQQQKNTDLAQGQEDGSLVQKEDDTSLVQKQEDISLVQKQEDISMVQKQEDASLSQEQEDVSMVQEYRAMSPRGLVQEQMQGTTVVFQCQEQLSGSLSSGSPSGGGYLPGTGSGGPGSPTAGGYITMLPAPPGTLRKTRSSLAAMSSSPLAPCTISKSSSFSAFSSQVRRPAPGPRYSDLVLGEEEASVPPALSRQELLQRFCISEQGEVGVRGLTALLPRPESTPPVMQKVEGEARCSPEPGHYELMTSVSTSLRLISEPRVRCQSGGSVLCSESSSGSSPFEVFVHLPGEPEDQDTDSELTEYYEQGKISHAALLSYRKNSLSLEAEEGDSESSSPCRWTVRNVIDRLSPARSKLGSLRRRRVTLGEGSQGEKAGSSGGQGAVPGSSGSQGAVPGTSGSQGAVPGSIGSQGEKVEEARPRGRKQMEVEGRMFSGASLEGAVLNLGQHRSSSSSVRPPDEVDSAMAVPPKTRSSLSAGAATHRSCLSPTTSSSPPQSLYDIPRLLAASSGQIMLDTTLSQADSVDTTRRPAESSGKLINRNIGAYENVTVSAQDTVDTPRVVIL